MFVSYTFRMSNHQLLARGSDSINSTPYSLTPSTSTSSTISEESLVVPISLYIHDVKVDQSSVKGSGSYGTVYSAKWYHSEVAAKKLHQIFFEHIVTSESKTGILRSFARETNMLIQMKHPNIVQFYGLYSSQPGCQLNSETYLIQELMHSSLEDRIHISPALTLRNIIDLSLDIVSGLRYLHDRQVPIIHRDLASKNILLTSTGVAKIADLGVAKILDESKQTPQSRLPGTELYMPPEVKIQGMSYDTKVDIYSFGVVILEMAIGRSAKANEAFRVNHKNSIVLTPEIERRQDDFDTLGLHPLRSVILKCLSRRDDRPSAKTVAGKLAKLCTLNDYQLCPSVPVILNDKELSKHEPEIEVLKTKIKELKCELAEGGSFNTDHQLEDLMRENASLQLQISYLRGQLAEGPSSLPEPLPSFATPNTSLQSEISHSVDTLDTLTELSLSKDKESSELRKLRKQVDKYKNANIDMDKKLKEARFELKRCNSTHRSRLEVDQLQSEIRQLQNQLDIASRENSYLHSQLSARRY